jgi:hypothetical protein
LSSPRRLRARLFKKRKFFQEAEVFRGKIRKSVFASN